MTSAAAVSAIGCEPMPPKLVGFASRQATSIMGSKARQETKAPGLTIPSGCDTDKPARGAAQKLRPALGGGMTSSLFSVDFGLFSRPVHGFSHLGQHLNPIPFLMRDNVSV